MLLLIAQPPISLATARAPQRGGAASASRPRPKQLEGIAWSSAGLGLPLSGDFCLGYDLARAVGTIVVLLSWKLGFKHVSTSRT